MKKAQQGGKSVPKMAGGGKLPAPAKPKSPMKANKGEKRVKAIEDRYGHVPIR